MSTEDQTVDPTVVQELEQQVEELNEELGNATVVTMTPIHDLSWKIKWFMATPFTIIGAMLTASGLEPWNILFGTVGLVGWGWVGVVWNDRALIVTNTFLAGAYSVSLVNWLQEVLK